MPRRTYETLAPELVEFAEIFAQDLEVRGHTVWAEKAELGYPFPPTLLARRQRTTIVVEVTNSIDYSRLDTWVRYGRSSGHDLRVIVGLPQHIQVSQKDRDRIRENGFGLATISKTSVDQVIPAQDLALNVSLPDLRTLPRALRPILGAAYEQFNQGLWREGFDEACKVLEIQARRYLRHWTSTGRIQLVAKKGPRVLKSSQIEKLTMGQLAEAFRQIAAKTYADSIIEKTLATINDDRVSVVHHKHKKRTEDRLRTNVGRDMWAIIEALKHLV